MLIGRTKVACESSNYAGACSLQRPAVHTDISNSFDLQYCRPSNAISVHQVSDPELVGLTY